MTDENGNGGPKPIDLGKVRQERNKKPKQEGISVDRETGNFLFPSSEPEPLTEQEAYVVSESIQKKYSSREVLEANFALRDTPSHADLFAEDLPPQEDLRTRVDKSLASQRAWARAFDSKTLIRIISLHNREPDRHFGTLLLAVAEEYLGRFSPRK